MSRLLEWEVGFALCLVAVQVAAYWLARRIRQWLSGPTAAPPPLSPHSRTLSYRSRPVDDEAPTIHDLAYLLGLPRWPAFGALCGLIHREVIELRGEVITPGSVPLPPDAAGIERALVPSERRLLASDALLAAASSAAPFYEGRLRRWGLLVRPSTDNVARFAAGCVGLAPFAFALARFSLAPLGWASLLLLAFMAYRFRLLVRPGLLTMRGTNLVAEAHRRLVVPEAASGSRPSWADDSDTVVAVAAAMGPPVMGTAALIEPRFAPVGRRHPPAAASPSKESVAALVAELGPTPNREFAAIRRRQLIGVPLLGLATCAALLWAGMASTPPASRPRRGAAFLHPPRPLAGPVPAPIRGRSGDRCVGSPEERARKRERALDGNPLVALAKLQSTRPRASRPDNAMHIARPGQIYAISKDTLHEIVLDGERNATSRVVGRLEVRVVDHRRYPQLSSRRDRPSPRLTSITISHDGALYLVGDSRIYVCSPSSLVCMSRGIVPFGTSAVAFVPSPTPRFAAFDSRGAWYRIEMLGAPAPLGEAVNEFIATTELCVDRYAGADPRFELLGNPTPGYDGRLYAPVYDTEQSGTRLATLDPESGATTPLTGVIANSPIAGSLIATPDRVLLLTRRGAIWSYDRDQRLFRRIGQTDFEFVGAAAFFEPATPATPKPQRNPETP